MAEKIVTLESIVQAKFVTIRSVKANGEDGGYAVHLRPTNDHDVDVCVHISNDRAAAMGLSPTA